MDFYIVLGLSRDATLNDIKRAYKRLARKFHPDINPGDRRSAAQFRQIAEAYETLSDPDRRRRYDSTGPSPLPGHGDRTYGFEGFDFSVSVSGTDAPTFGDLFGDIFRHREREPAEGAERGADLHQALTVGFEEAIRGGQRSIAVTRQERCRTCAGAGQLNVAEAQCVPCHGSGIVTSTRGHMIFSKACPHCGGTGRHRSAICPTCDGQQVETRTEALAINIPAGLRDGARIRIPGKGHAGRNGGETGDLYIAVQVQPHSLFRREGDDLHLTVPVGVHEAALGAKIEVPALDGPARVRIPPGTQSGQKFRLRERGIPSARDGRRGDLVVEVRLALPRVLNERSKELLREFGRINDQDLRSDLTGGPERR